jgi:hypothetical protein
MRRVALVIFVACGADQKPEHTTPVATATASASTTIASAAPVDAGPKDWMWELVAGAREAWWRWPSGACEKWRVDPDGAPAEYRGTLFHEDNGIELQMTYEGGDPPKIKAPRVVRDRGDAGTLRLDLVCGAEEHGAWYLDEASCQAGGTPTLAPTGCLSAVAPESRASATRALDGGLRKDFAAAIERAHFVWTSSDSFCVKRVVRKRGTKLFLNDAYLYPSLVHWTMLGLVLEELAEPNPDHVAPRGGGGEEIAIGCCGSVAYVVQSFDQGVARVAFMTPRFMKSETWYVDRAPPPDACKVKP